MLVFNPPYVPTSEDDVWAGDLRFSWKGGGMGMDTTWVVLDQLEVILAPGGEFYLVAVERNDPKGILSTMKTRGFEAEVILRRKAGGEVLYVLRFTKPKIS